MILNHVKLSISLSPFLRKVQHDFASPCAALLWLASHALGRAQKDAVSITTLHPRLVTVRGSCSWTAESDAAPSRAILRISHPISPPPPAQQRDKNLRRCKWEPKGDPMRGTIAAQGGCPFKRGSSPHWRKPVQTGGLHLGMRKMCSNESSLPTSSEFGFGENGDF